MRPYAFLLLCALACLSGCVSGSRTAATPPWRDQLLTRVEIPQDQNALTRWRPSFPRLFPDDTRLADQLQTLSSPLVDRIDPADLELENWLASVAPVVSELVIQDGERFQLPALHGPETPFPDHQPLRQLALVRLALLKEAWLDGRKGAALQLALDNLALARAMLASQEGLVPLIQGTGLWQLALDGVYWLARQDTLTSPDALRLQIALAADDRLAADALTRAFRGEFTFFTRVVVDRLPQTRDVDLLLSGIGTLGMAPPVPPGEGEPRLALPPAACEPLDREATLQAASDDIAGWLAAFARLRYPRGLGERHTYARLQAYAHEIAPLFRYATEDGPVTPELVEQTNHTVATVANPVGKLFLVIATSQWDPLAASVFRREAQRSALTGLLAWRRFGHPADWATLVAAGLLPAPPADPFSDGPLRFDLSRPRIWSVGQDGRDDGGQGDGENLGQPADLTWPLPGQ